MAIHQHQLKSIAIDHAKELRQRGFKASVHKLKKGCFVYSYRK